MCINYLKYTLSLRYNDNINYNYLRSIFEKELGGSFAYGEEQLLSQTENASLQALIQAEREKN